MVARLTSSGPSLSLDDLQHAEQRLGIHFPDDYRSFLLAQNGGKPRPAWFRLGEDPGEVAEITQLFSLEEMEAPTRSLRRNSGFGADFIAIGTSSDTDVLLLAIAPLQRGAVFWASDDVGSGNDPVHVADSIEQLLASLDYPEPSKPWMMLIDDDDVEGLRQWLDNGGDVQAGDDVVLGITALEHAAARGRLEIVKLLVSRGAQPRPGLRRTCPHRYALQAGHRDIADFLAKQGMAKGYWLHYFIGAAFALVAIGLWFVPQPRELLQNNVVLILYVSAVVIAVGIGLAYERLRKSETGAADPSQEPGRSRRST